MINRLVKLSFHAEDAGKFTELFREVSEKIRAFPGCLHLELWEDLREKGVFFTFSQWDSEASLDHYRFSPLFKSVWAHVKPLFKAPAEAWSVRKNPVDS
ncbi:MAG TPA: antibiotic biosynthesis monooxygenase [Bacteroidia bacterium]|nr:antibiotic biosynthesis monooxygenase [Bacteroidia bacterium]